MSIGNINRSVDDSDLVTYFQQCAICRKSMGTMTCSPKMAELFLKQHCPDCIRAVKVAQMQAAGTLTEVANQIEALERAR